MKHQQFCSSFFVANAILAYFAIVTSIVENCRVMSEIRYNFEAFPYQIDMRLETKFETFKGT